MMKHPDEMFRLVLVSHGFKKDELRGDCRSRPFVEARMEYIRLARDEGYSAAAIGRHLNRDHTSVIHLMKKMEAKRERKAVD